MLDVRRIRVLVEVARLGSFSAAAAELGYTQPAISRQIATLEAEIGMPLVRRVPSGALLTDAGRLLVARGEGILARLTEAESELRALNDLDGGTLRFGTFASAAASVVPLAISLFRARHPRVELSIEMADPVESVPQLRAGRLDMTLIHDAMDGSAPPLGAARLPGWLELTPDVELVPLFQDPMYVVLASQHPLANSPTLELGQLAEDPWMLATSDTCPDSRLFIAACVRAGFEPQVAFQNDDYGAILGFVAAGVGAALIPDMIVRRGVRDDIVVRELDPPPASRPIGALVPSGYRAPAVAAMLEILREVSDEWVLGRVFDRPVALSA
jgi:DNA-binding transcriptional LysR family regulator